MLRDFQGFHHVSPHHSQHHGLFQSPTACRPSFHRVLEVAALDASIEGLCRCPADLFPHETRFDSIGLHRFFIPLRFQYIKHLFVFVLSLSCVYRFWRNTCMTNIAMPSERFAATVTVPCCRDVSFLVGDSRQHQKLFWCPSFQSRNAHEIRLQTTIGIWNGSKW